jgi:citrate lyase beta subunit
VDSWDFYQMANLDAENERHAANASRMPQNYSTELAIKVCVKIAEDTRGIAAIYEDNKDWFPPPTTLMRWRAIHPVFAMNLDAARRYQTQALIDEIVGIIDDPANCEPEILGWAKERVKTRQWLATRILPKIYGDRQQVETTVKHEDNIKDLG